MFYFALILLIVLLLILAISIFNAGTDFLASRTTEELLKPKTPARSVFNELDDNFKFGENYLGKHNTAKIIIVFCALLFVCCVFLGPLLTNAYLGVFLGVVMTLAYTSRVTFHIFTGFRKKVLSQLERIFLSIRNNLSTGMTLDYAVNESIKYIDDEPLGPHLASFVRLSEGNFVEKFPSWLKSVQRTFRLKELAESAQILSLELKHTNNQEEAFINAAQTAADKNKANSKQKNILNISFITLDFMVLSFLALIFILIPQISDSWWQSDVRAMTVFSSAIIIWLLYAVAVTLAIWRQA